jgi:hypothetical protein
VNLWSVVWPNRHKNVSICVPMLAERSSRCEAREDLIRKEDV